MEADEDYSSGTVRFLRGAVKACRSGVRRCHLISYQENGTLLQELFSRDGIGTQIVMESAEQIRRATINDIGGILELISPLEQQGILVRRSREQLEMEIDKFTIIQRDNTTIACAALYPFPEEKIGEMACVAVHPDYRSSSRGEVLLERIAAQAKQMGLSKLFVLTTRSIHWFQERGFTPVDVDLLPESKRDVQLSAPLQGADGRPGLIPSPRKARGRPGKTSLGGKDIRQAAASFGTRSHRLSQHLLIGIDRQLPFRTRNGGINQLAGYQRHAARRQDQRRVIELRPLRFMHRHRPGGIVLRQTTWLYRLDAAIGHREPDAQAIASFQRDADIAVKQPQRAVVAGDHHRPSFIPARMPR
jgi:N-acetylglutamate synthase-like GNAT family acetyltransferase